MLAIITCNMPLTQGRMRNADSQASWCSKLSLPWYKIARQVFYLELVLVATSNDHIVHLMRREQSSDV